MKKNVIIILLFILSILISCLGNENIFLLDSKNLISILLTILGLCFASFSFVSASLSEITKDIKDNNELLIQKQDKVLKSLSADVLFIFYASIVLIIINFIFYINIPFIKDPINLDFGIFIIKSLKTTMIYFGCSFTSCLAFYSFYDLMVSTFKLLRKK